MVCKHQICMVAKKNMLPSNCFYDMYIMIASEWCWYEDWSCRYWNTLKLFSKIGLQVSCMLVAMENMLLGNRCYAMYSLHWLHIWKCLEWCDVHVCKFSCFYHHLNNFRTDRLDYQHVRTQTRLSQFLKDLDNAFAPEF